jgi:signal transduction histidine kinase
MVETQIDNDLSIRLADAIRNISAMFNSGATCCEVSFAVVQCAVTMSPGARAIVFDVTDDRRGLRVLASANTPFAKVGQKVALPENSILRRVVDEPYRAHHESLGDANPIFPLSLGFPDDPDDVVIYKAVSREGTQAQVLAIIAEPENIRSTTAIVMTLSELLIALCMGREAPKEAEVHTSRQAIIARAKHEWERTIDSVPEVVCLVDQDGAIVRINRTVERWGLSDVRNARGVDIHTLFHKNCAMEQCAFRDAVSLDTKIWPSGSHRESTFRDDALRRTLTVHTKLIDALPVTPDQSALPFAVVVVSDVTALSEAQKALNKLNSRLEDRVHRRTSELSALNSKLRAEISHRRVMEIDLQKSRDELAELTDQLLRAQEDERQRLSRELHDSLGQSLGAIKYSLERVMVMQADPTHGDPKSEIATIIGRVGDLARETRVMAMGLRPPVLDDMGVVSAMKWLCQAFINTYTEIDFRVELEIADDDVPVGLWTPIYRIVQEAMNNVVKHAAAKNVLVSLGLNGDLLRLEILDDGVGFDNRANDTGQFKKLGKHGRLGMRERAINSNGTVEVESWLEKGTRVRAEWSMSDASIGMEQR